MDVEQCIRNYYVLIDKNNREYNNAGRQSKREKKTRTDRVWAK